MTRDAEGHREYRLKVQVEAAGPVGPAAVLSTPGLPLPGAIWDFEDDLLDPWASCKLNASVTPVQTTGPTELWEVEFTFSTKGDAKRCRDEQITDPLLEAPKISGGFTRYTLQATHDRFGLPITNSALETVRGQAVEFDANRPHVKIEFNVPTFDLIVLAYQFQDHVNASPLWGFPPRCVKLNVGGWEKKYFGSCESYYTLPLEFEIRPDGFDRVLLDEGTKALSGHWQTILKPGTGATFDLTVGPGGTITGATVTGAGTQYPVSSTVTLYLIQSANSGTGGSITVTTNGSGGVSAVTLVNTAGQGYASGTAGSLTQSARWIQDPIGGLPPNPRNPSHFNQFKDRRGENARVILDGHGLPAEAITGSGNRFISVTVPNTGNGIRSGNSWVELLTDPGQIPETRANDWDNDPPPTYRKGEVISFALVQFGQKKLYLCFADDTIEPPIDSDGNPVADWIDLLRTLDQGLNQVGNWSATFPYGLGDVVVDLSISGPGKIPISYYPSADFLLLGIPVVL